MAVGKRRRSKRLLVRKSQSRATPEPNPLSPFRQGRGKPTLRQEYLDNERDKLLYMIGPYWYALEWNLSHARTLQAVGTALAIEQFRLNPGPLLPFFRDSFQQASRKQLEMTRKELGQANEQARNAQIAYQEQVQAFNESERVAFSVSDEAEKNIREELQKRTANLSTIQEAIEVIQQLIREYEFWQKTRTIPGVPSIEVTALSELSGRLDRHKQADDPVCAGLAARIRSITPQVRKIATENAARQKSLLSSAERQQREANERQKSVQERYLDQQAFIYRNEVLKFLQAKEYRLTPLTLANAIAGLPYISARHSAQLCSRLKTSVPPFTRYEMLQFVKSVLKMCTPGLSSPVAQVFEREIRKLPKFRIVEGQRRPNSLRVELAKDWHYLRRALEDPELANLHPGAVPGAIVAIFLRKQSNPESPITPTLAEAEKITD